MHAKFLDLIANFNVTKEGYFNWDYDIALIQLNISPNEEVEVIDLPPPSYNVSEVGTATCKAAGKLYISFSAIPFQKVQNIGWEK